VNSDVVSTQRSSSFRQGNNDQARDGKQASNKRKQKKQNTQKSNGHIISPLRELAE
jgi:hypothetical protein